MTRARRPKAAGGRARPAAKTKKPGPSRRRGRRGRSGSPPRRGGRRGIVGRLARWLAAAAIWTVLALAAVVGWYALDLPDPGALAGQRGASVTVLGADGSVLASYGEVHGEPVHFDDLPPHLVAAVLATEDRRFFRHWGLDMWGIVRAAWHNLRAGRLVQGGSTVTQQLAKNLFLTPERSLKRKLQELLLALWLERRFGKEELFAIYVNRIYLGAGTYGVDAAARHYFGTSAGGLSLLQSATIAGLIKAPSRFNPVADPAAARARAALALDSMVAAGVLDRADAERAKAAPLGLVGSSASLDSRRYATDWIAARARDYLGTAAGDLVIASTISPGLQRRAAETLAAALASEGAARHAGQGALVAMAPDGAVLAMIGGRHYGSSQFNRAVQARRQPGSAFKLFVYLAALEAGWSPDDTVTDRPVAIRGWSPRNFDGRHRGAVTLREAFADSINTVAAQTAWRVGLERVAALAHRLGMTAELEALPSLALGTTEVSLLELTAAYATLANQGRFVRPHVISEIRGRDGRLLYRRPDTAARPVLDRATVAAMADMLTATLETGTGRAARLDRPAGGKTGTSQGHRDAWFVGYSRDLVAGVWLGNDDNRSMDGVTGGGLPARIWAAFMSGAERGRPARALVDAPASAAGAERDGGLGGLIRDLFGDRGGRRRRRAGRAASPGAQAPSSSIRCRKEPATLPLAMPAGPRSRPPASVARNSASPPAARVRA